MQILRIWVPLFTLPFCLFNYIFKLNIIRTSIEGRRRGGSGHANIENLGVCKLFPIILPASFGSLTTAYLEYAPQILNEWYADNVIAH